MGVFYLTEAQLHVSKQVPVFMRDCVCVCMQITFIIRSLIFSELASLSSSSEHTTPMKLKMKLIAMKNRFINFALD